MILTNLGWVDDEMPQSESKPIVLPLYSELPRVGPGVSHGGQAGLPSVGAGAGTGQGYCGVHFAAQILSHLAD